MTSVRLEDLCSVLRSKNAGPFLITLDMIFRDEQVYRVISEKKLITAELIAHMYGISVGDVVVLEQIDHLKAIKATIRRRVPSGSPGDPDCYGMNQEGPLLAVRFPGEVFAGAPAVRQG
jgi:hypothetical protein